MEPTDEMVEAAFKIYHPKGFSNLNHRVFYKNVVRDILRAALAAIPDRYREGWIAGRDAAANLTFTGRSSDEPLGNYPALVRAAIRNLEPPT